MDYMTKRSTRYKTMAAKGVYAGQLYCLNSWNGRWMVELNHASHVSKELAKDIAREFLESEFEAFAITFVVLPDKPFGWFAAKFNSEVL